LLALTGDVAQLVEQRTENPCVSGSIPLITTIIFHNLMKTGDNSYKFERVLLVDDNDIDNFINERMITTNNFSKQVTVKNSGEAALQSLRDDVTKGNTLPEVVFLDLNMPVMDGFAFLAEFENLPEAVKSGCKVIVLSSSISPEDINRASTNPYVAKYINKPLNEKYLEAINF
jgi:CheY-like chemotaxis protein